MDISSKQVLNKIEELVDKAKQSHSEDMLKGYIIAIQALCEVMVHDQPPAPISKVRNKGKQMAVQTVSSLPTMEPVKIDDANGHSLFDF